MIPKETENKELSISCYVEAYLNAKSELANLKAEFDKKKKEMTEVMEVLTDHILQYTKDNNIKSIKTEFGTAYQTTTTKVSVKDWDAFFDFVVENKAAEFINKSPKKTTVCQYLEDEGSLPPGIDLASSLEINVRRS